MQTYDRDDNKALRRKPSDRGRTPSPQSGRRTPADHRSYDSRRSPSPQSHHSHRSSHRGSPAARPRSTSPEFAEVNVSSILLYYENGFIVSQNLEYGDPHMWQHQRPKGVGVDPH